jgi:phosphatidylserine/phosphatidylglycerophosphate/cardiolipin synthase-like enzyme
MRQMAQKNQISVKAYAGSTGVLLGITLEPALRVGLLGFAIARRDGRNGKKEWLTGLLDFPGRDRLPGIPIPSNRAPLQKFRWSDYRVYPGITYEYTIHAVYGTPAKLELAPGPTVTVTTASPADDHYVVFNRAAAASQAFSRKFPEVEEQLAAARKAKQEPPPLPPPVLDWLSRGVLEEITGLINQATDATWGLDIAIYEYELPAIVAAVVAAHQRGVPVRIVYHAKPDDPQTAENIKHLADLPSTCLRARPTSKIFHDKFIVLSRIQAGQYSPIAVLCGSTNFTHNGVYRQANVVHRVKDSAIAQQYLNLFNLLFNGADPGSTRRWINQNNPMPNPVVNPAVNPAAAARTGNPVFVGFSPRSGGGDLTGFINIIQSARQDVLFCTAFDLHDPLEQALLGEANDAILRYGLQNSRSKITGIHADRTADFVATAMLSQGLEGFLKESTKGQKGNILIHTKLMIVDFTSDRPIVISGSHNLSKAASESNDENFLILQGNLHLADCYGCELMRLYDHYRFRFRTNNPDPRHPAPPLTLVPDDGWTQPYFEVGSLKARDRQCFAGINAR